MKIIVLHGEHETLLYQRLSRFMEAARERNWQLVEISQQENLAEELTKTSLFSKNDLFVLRLDKVPSNKSLTWLKKNASSLPGTLVIYRLGRLPAGFLKFLPKDTKVEEFKIPKTLFKFLDSLYPGNLKETLIQLEGVTAVEPFELVFHLVAKQLRDIYWVKVGNGLPYPDWRVTKLKSVARRFDEGKLKDMIGELSEIDVDIKTGKADPISSLDLFLARTLQ